MKVWSALGAIVWQDTGRRLAMRARAGLDAVALPRLGDGIGRARALESTGRGLPGFKGIHDYCMLAQRIHRPASLQPSLRRT